MKVLLIAIVAFALGFLGGVQYQNLRRARKDVEQLLRFDRDAQHVTTVLSLAALNHLEDGETYKAKLLLARQVALYYYAPQNGEDSFSPQQRLLPSIDATATKSAVLREKMQKGRK